MLWLIVVILLIAALGGAPGWGWHSHGWGPSGLLGAVVLALIILLLIGRI